MCMGLMRLGRQKYTQQNHQVLESSASEVELFIEKQKSNRSPGIDQMPVELIKSGVGVRQFAMRFINLLFLFGIMRNCPRSGRSQS